MASKNVNKQCNSRAEGKLLNNETFMIRVGGSQYNIAFHKITITNKLHKSFTKNEVKFKLTIRLSRDHDKITNKVHK